MSASTPHRRLNPLLNSYVLCSPQRTARPWLGALEAQVTEKGLSYDPNCFLCPRNLRIGGQRNEDYQTTFVFPNDFPAVLPLLTPSSDPTTSQDPLFTLEPAHGLCKVICFSPHHDLTIASLSDQEIGGIIKAWKQVYITVSGENDWIKYVQIFENKGSIMGCSNPHPHGQVWSLDYIPSTPLKMLNSMKDYAHNEKFTPGAPVLKNGLPSLLLSYAFSELKQHNLFLSSPSTQSESRVVHQNSDFLAIVPFWAAWPFEIMILPYKRHIASLSFLNPEEELSLSSIIGIMSRKYDNLFKCSFGYSMGIYQSPIYTPPLSSSLSPPPPPSPLPVPIPESIKSDKSPPPIEEKEDEESVKWDNFAQFHLNFYPPLLRSSSVKKFIVGFELFAEIQRDITPEQAAARLRDCEEVHYLDFLSIRTTTTKTT